MKQNKQNKNTNMCKIRIQQYFIAKIKQEQNKVVTGKHTQN